MWQMDCLHQSCILRLRLRDDTSLAKREPEMASITCSSLLNSAGLSACCPCKAFNAAGRDEAAALHSARSLFAGRAAEALQTRPCKAVSKPVRYIAAATRCQTSDVVLEEGGVSRRAACLGAVGAALALSVQKTGEASARELEVRSWVTRVHIQDIQCSSKVVQFSCNTAGCRLASNFLQSKCRSL